MPDAKTRVTQARNNLILGHPFWGTLSLNLDVVEDSNVETFGVDGKTLRYSPEYAESLPFDQIVGSLAHEVMHCALGHHARRGKRDLHDYNVAADYVINPLLLDEGFTLPAGVLVDSRFRDMSVEQVYTIVHGERRQREESQAGDDGTGTVQGDAPSGVGVGEPGKATFDVGGTGSFSDGPGEGSPATQGELAEQSREWEIATMQAAAAARAAGTLPGSAQYTVDEIKRPKIDWRDVLREFVTVRAQSEKSWIPPNKRYIAQGLYLPGSSGLRMGELVVVVDSSGSTFGPMLTAFNDELNGIVEDIEPAKTHVLCWDTREQGFETYERDDLPIKISPRGAGGTDFSGIWPYLEERGIDPTCLVCLTDLDLRRFGDEPDYPVLWCSTSKTTAPFGDVVRLTL